MEKQAAREQAVREQDRPLESIQSFEYEESADAPFVPSWSGWDDAPDASPGGGTPMGTGDHPGREARVPSPPEKSAEFEARLAEEARRSFESGRARGIEEGRVVERQAREESLVVASQQRIRQVAALMESFAAQREQYFRSLEPEVVRLSLAVAARILRREAASDPLLLMGAVRTALGQISGSTEVRLRVPAAELDLWTEAIAVLPNLASKPTVLAGEGMALGACRIETALGTADLGVRAQLAEVERALLGDSGRLDSGHLHSSRSDSSRLEPQREAAMAAAESAA